MLIWYNNGAVNDNLSGVYCMKNLWIWHFWLRIVIEAILSANRSLSFVRHLICRLLWSGSMCVCFFFKWHAIQLIPSAMYLLYLNWASFNTDHGLNRISRGIKFRPFFISFCGFWFTECIKWNIERSIAFAHFSPSLGTKNHLLV